MKIQAFVIIVIACSICFAVDVDFSSGSYKIKSQELKDKEKYERREP